MSKFFDKIKKFFKKSKKEVEEVKEKIEDVVEKIEKVENVVKEVKSRVSLFSEFEDHIHKVCVALFLKYFYKRNGGAVYGDTVNLHYKLIPSMKYVMRDIIHVYETAKCIIATYSADKYTGSEINKTDLNMSIILYFNKLILNKKECAAFRKDVIALAETISTPEELELYINNIVM